MSIILDIIYAILLITSGMWLIKYRRNVKWWTGNFVWAERYIWNWGTYFVMIIVWLFMIFLWILYPFGWLDLLFWPTRTEVTLGL